MGTLSFRTCRTWVYKEAFIMIVVYKIYIQLVISFFLGNVDTLWHISMHYGTLDMYVDLQQ